MRADQIYQEMLQSLRDCLEHLDRLRMVHPDDKRVLELKCSLREQIRRIEDRE